MTRAVNSSGFTLIEVILVVLVIAVAIPPILTLFSQNITDGHESEVHTKATLFAVERMEEVLGDKRAEAAGYGWDFILQPGQYPNDTPEAGYTRSVSIDTSGNTFQGVTFADIAVSVSHADITTITVKSRATNYE